MPLFTLTLNGAPVATAELPPDRGWAGGRVSPLAGFDLIRPLLEAAAEEPSLAASLLELPSGEDLPAIALCDVPIHIAAAYQGLARLRFELLDEAGLPAEAELVRLAPLGAPPNAVVRVCFRGALATSAARSLLRPRAGGGTA